MWLQLSLLLAVRGRADATGRAVGIATWAAIRAIAHQSVKSGAATPCYGRSRRAARAHWADAASVRAHDRRKLGDR